MDYAERGAIEKTFDTILTDSANGLEAASRGDTEGLVDSQGHFSAAGRLYTTGIIVGMLTTIRTFSDDTSEFTEEDATEIDRIVRRREPEMTRRLSGQDDGDPA